MLTLKTEFLTIAEVNPPPLPDQTHRRLEGTWSHVLITDNVFGRIRLSPYAFGARITHDVPAVHPTVVVSTRDRNVLAIESEVRGALGNGVDSFLVVSGDTFPSVEHRTTPGEVIEHLRNLQGIMPAFEVGAPTGFDHGLLRRKVEAGSQFLVTRPVLDAGSLERALDDLDPEGVEPPVYVAVMPPFSPTWVEKAEAWGAVPVGSPTRSKLEEIDPASRRAWAWEMTEEMRSVAAAGGAAGVIIMGLKFDTLVGDAATRLRPS